MYYYSFNQYLREKFGVKVHKLSLNAGFSCPNKDGTLSREGCIFCNEEGFSRFAKTNLPLRQQIDLSMARVKKRLGVHKFIAYFQNAAGTNAQPERLKPIYDTIKEYPEIVGLSISTRPDCVTDEKLDLIANFTQGYEVWIEYGLTTVHDRTLKTLNRNHTFSQSVDTIVKTAARDIKVGVHVILGLPGESELDMIKTAQEISRLPVTGVKLHVLHVLKSTQLEKLYLEGKITLLDRDEYVKMVCRFIENSKPDCVILRLVSDAKKEFLVAPQWMNDKLSVIKRIEDEFVTRDAYQGSREIVRD